MTFSLPSPLAARLGRSGQPSPLGALATRFVIRRSRPSIERVLTAIAASGDEAWREATAWTIHRARRSVGGGLVLFVGPPAGPILAVRVASAELGVRAIHREERALGALGAVDLPAAFRELLPDVVATGEEEGVAYVAQRVLPGRPADPRGRTDEAGRAGLASIATVIGMLHEGTASVRTATTDDVKRWVDRRVDLVRRLATNDDPLDRSVDARLAALRSSLRDALLGSQVRTSRIHGDLWAGNVLVEATERGGLTVTGLVDWDSSAADELPLQDLLHLELYARKLAQRTSLGSIIAAALAGGPDQDGVARSPGGDPNPTIPRERLLLYWLRQVEVNLTRNPTGTGNPRWRRRNVDPVVACL